MPPSMQVDNTTVTVWEDLTNSVRRSQLHFDMINNEPFVSFSQGTGTAIRVTNLAMPVGDADATNKLYVDSLIRGLVVKAPVRAVSVVSVTLADLIPAALIDGVSLQSGDRILLIGQADGTENGIYQIQTSGPPARTPDLAPGSEATGVYCFVDEGAVYIDRSFVCTTNRITANVPSSVVGTNALEWVQFNARSSAMAGQGLVTGSANELDVNVDNTTIQITNDTLNIVHPDIKLKAVRGLLRSATDGTTATAPTTDSAAPGTLGYTVPLGQNVTLAPDFTVIPDLAATNTFTAANNFVSSASASWVPNAVPGQEPALSAAVVIPAGGLVVRHEIIASQLELRDTTNATSATTGAMVVDGGVGVAKDVFVGQDAHITGAVTADTAHLSSATNSTSAAAGALGVDGGAGLAKDVFIGQNLRVTADTSAATAHLTDLTTSTSPSTGALQVAGGVGIAKDVQIGASLTVAADVTAATAHLLDTTDSTSTATGALVVAGGVGIAKTVHIGGAEHVAGDVPCNATSAAAWAAGTTAMAGALVVEGGAAIRTEVQCATAHLLATTAATSATTGALVVDGGVGVAGAVYAGGAAHVIGNTHCDNATAATWTAGTLPTDAPTLTGALQVIGGVAVAKGLECLTAHVHDTTDSASITTGATVIDGGLGVAKAISANNARLGGNIAATSTSTGTLVISGGVGINGDMYVNNTYNMSDARLKKNVVTIDNALDRVCKMRGCTFEWNERMVGYENVPCVGVIAQEIRDTAPLCVSHNPESDLYAVEYTKLVPFLIESVKSLKRQCDELRSSLESKQPLPQPEPRQKRRRTAK